MDDGSFWNQSREYRKHEDEILAGKYASGAENPPVAREIVLHQHLRNVVGALRRYDDLVQRVIAAGFDPARDDADMVEIEFPDGDLRVIGSATLDEGYLEVMAAVTLAQDVLTQYGDGAPAA